MRRVSAALLAAILFGAGLDVAMARQAGDYSQTCQGCSDDGGMLSCDRCQTKDGAWQPGASLRYIDNEHKRRCAYVVNYDGRLLCDRWRKK